MKVVYFWANWNGRSKMQKEIIEKYCEKHDIDYSLINVDDNVDAMEDYDVDHIPVMLVLNDYDVPLVTHYGKLDEQKLIDIFKKI